MSLIVTMNIFCLTLLDLACFGPFRTRYPGLSGEICHPPPPPPPGQIGLNIWSNAFDAMAKYDSKHLELQFEGLFRQLD